MAIAPDPSPALFELRFRSRSERVRVSSFRAREEISKLGRLDVRGTTDALDPDLAPSLLDEPASLFLFEGGEPIRAFHGIVARAEAHGALLQDRQALSLSVVPALCRLKRRRTRRIFQDQTTAEIASRILDEWGIKARFAVHRSLPARGYCAQYDETDLAFLARLFAEEGLFYFFEHPLEGSPAPEEIVVIADAPAACAPIEPDEPLRFERVQPESAMKARDDQVTWFAAEGRVRAARSLVRGHDFRRPWADLRDEAAADEARAREVVYEHEGSYEDDLGPRPAAVRLEQARRKVARAEGTSFCRRLAPARRFTLQGHDLASLDRAWVVSRVEHEGYAAEVMPPGRALYQNRFTCAPAEVPIRPTWRPQRPRQVAETAVVVGPPGQEIHTDKHGRVKVRFHWDLAPRGDGESSCWLRVAHAWAGAGWGAQFIPRVGMEVLVTYLGGDPDRPLVTGSVYNATHPPPFPLPEHRTRSGIRTASTPGSAGANEISFEDAAGGEQIYLHAQRDYDEVIERDQTSRVGGGRAVEVAGGASERVGMDASLDVAGHRRTAIGGDDESDIGGRSRALVKGDRALEVQGSMATTVHQGHALEVRGPRALVVGTPDRSAPSDHYVHGTASLGASERLVLQAEQGVVIQCGEASIELSPDKIVLRAKTVELSPTQVLECSTKDGPSVTLAEDVEILSKKFRLFTEAGALEVDREFKAAGDKIKLGYDPSKPSRDKQGEDPETKPFSCKLSNYFLQPYANKKYHLMAEGLRFEGETDGEGMVKAKIPRATKQVVVRLWLDSYPEGRQRVYTLKLEELPSVDEVLGAKVRLRNLGYYHGTIDGAPNEEMRAALAEFQGDHQDTHGLEPTGELDTGTAGALEEVHGS